MVVKLFRTPSKCKCFVSVGTVFDFTFTSRGLSASTSACVLFWRYKGGGRLLADFNNYRNLRAIAT